MKFCKAILLTLLTATISISGCKKSATIYGTWQETSVRQTDKTNDSTIYDVTSPIPGGGAAFTFTVSSGYFSSYSNGRYTKNGNTLLLTDTAANHTVSFTILTLTDQVLVLQQTDTISLSPLSTVQFTYTLSPA